MTQMVICQLTALSKILTREIPLGFNHTKKTVRHRPLRRYSMNYKRQLQALIKQCSKIIVTYIKDGYAAEIGQWLFDNTDYQYRRRRTFVRTDRFSDLPSAKLCELVDHLQTVHYVYNQVPMVERRKLLMNNAISLVERTIRTKGPFSIYDRLVTYKLGDTLSKSGAAPLYTLTSLFETDVVIVKVYFIEEQLIVKGSLPGTIDPLLTHRFNQLHEKDICAFADFL